MVEIAATWEPIESVKPWDKNPRKNDGEPVDRVAKSIQRFGFSSPIVCREQDRRIIAGHTRWKAARKLGLTQVPVRFVPLDEAEAAALALADNKLTEITPWDDEALAGVLRDLEAQSVDLDGLGWKSEEIDALLKGLDPEPPAATDEVPEVQAEVHSKPGEVYALGPNRLICGDCRDPDVVARLLDGRKINIAFTSPPYASQRTYDESSGFKPIPPDEYVEWFEAVQANVRAHLAADGSWFVNIKEHSEGGQRSLYVKDLTINHVRRWGWRFVDEFCWLRQALPGDPNSMRKFKNGFELVFHFAVSERFKFNPDKVMHESAHVFAYADQKKAGRDISASSQGKGRNAQSPVGQGQGMAYPSNVIDLRQGAQVTGHSAAFPVLFPLFFVQAFTDEGDAVYDPFMGSGTTMMAAAQSGRVAFGCEISPAYCDLIRRRWTRYAKDAGIDPGEGALDG